MKRGLWPVVAFLLAALITPPPANGVSVAPSVKNCLERALGKAATQKIIKATRLSSAQSRSLARCKSKTSSTTSPSPTSAGSSTSTSSPSPSPTTKAAEPWYWTFNWDYVTALPLKPDCTTSTPLTRIPAPFETIRWINRRGYSQPGVHTLPVPHHNIFVRDLRQSGEKDENGHLLVSERIDPIVSPANLTLTAIAQNVYGRNSTTGEVYDYEEWMIALHVCGTKYIVFNHIDDIPKEWLAAIKAPGVREECAIGQDRARVCMYSYLSVPVRVGDRIGRASGRSGGWDLGGWDTSTPTPGVLDPGKNTARWATGTCVWDWFTPDLKAKAYDKFLGDQTSCGTHGHDLINSLAGVWLAVGKRNQAFTEDLHIALIPSYLNDGTYRFSIGFDSNIPSLPGGIYEFRANTAGLYNPVFSNVRSGQVACFDTFDQYYNFDKSVTRIYASMTAGETERITVAGVKGGTCGTGPYTIPSGAQTFERRTQTTG